MTNYQYEKSENITKKLVGFYDADNHTVNVDGTDRDILAELQDFEGAAIELIVRVKNKVDLTEEI